MEALKAEMCSSFYTVLILIDPYKKCTMRLCLLTLYCQKILKWIMIQSS